MALLGRTLLLAAIAIGGISVLAPLAARSAAPLPPEMAHHLLTVAEAPTPGIDRGTLTGREGRTTPSMGLNAPAETLGAEAAAASPPITPMEATLVTIAPPAALAPPAPAPRAVTYTGTSVWDDLARCESGGNWSINSGNGYYGGLQFSHATWHGYGGGEFAEYPHEATREEQIVVAERLRAARGYGPWPACRAKLGLP
jgi:hypothetical protein